MITISIKIQKEKPCTINALRPEEIIKLQELKSYCGIEPKKATDKQETFILYKDLLDRDDIAPLRYFKSFYQWIARVLLTQPVKTVEEFMGDLSCEDREKIVSAIWDEYHKRCSKI